MGDLPFEGARDFQTTAERMLRSLKVSAPPKRSCGVTTPLSGSVPDSLEVLFKPLLSIAFQCVVHVPCCPEIHCQSSCGLPTVIVQQSAETRTTFDPATRPVVSRCTDHLLLDELSADTLVKTLGQIVLDEFLDQVAQMSPAESDELVQTFEFDRLNKSPHVRIAIWALRRDLHALHAPQSAHRRDCDRRHEGR